MAVEPVVYPLLQLGKRKLLDPFGVEITASVEARIVHGSTEWELSIARDGRPCERPQDLWFPQLVLIEGARQAVGHA